MNDIIINNSNVTITPTHLPKKQKHFKKMWKIGGWRLYLTHNFRLKNSTMRDQERNHNGICKVKEKKFAKTNGHCEICGKKIERFSHSQLHHILSWWRFPQFECDERNLLLLCTECHRQIHKDPFVEVKMIRAKAKELGVNLKDYYNETDCD